MARRCGKRFAARYEEVCNMAPGHEAPCEHLPFGANLEDCRRLLRFTLKVIARGTDVQLIDARNFIEARMSGSLREPSSVIAEMWEDSK